MEKSNIIISIIIVLCIAAGVTAYGLTNNDNAVFSDLAGLDSDNGDHGLGNNTTKNVTNTSSSHGGSGDATDSSSGSGNAGAGSSGSGSSSGGSGSGSSYSSGSGGSSSSGSSSGGSSSSGSSSGGSSSGGSGSGSGGSNNYPITASDAVAIASQHIITAGAYAGTPTDGGSVWYVPVLDSNGNNIGIIAVDKTTGFTSEG